MENGWSNHETKYAATWLNEYIIDIQKVLPTHQGQGALFLRELLEKRLEDISEQNYIVLRYIGSLWRINYEEIWQSFLQK